ncbi:MAG TPA: DUF397 domain-containing protein [Pseudonocardiaceae bacterium]|jgi:hypothetical protein|nr:DUF397 domain-containing protein [Pseudonocardiaceae bacterium]
MTATELDGIVWRTSSYSGTNGNCVEVGWRKSSYSGTNGDCVEVGWRKSSHSGGNGDCVEVKVELAGVAVRDSKHSTGPTLAFPTSNWRAFLEGSR